MPILFRDLPGPKGIPFFGSAFDMELSNMHNQFQEMADEYGSVYKIKLGPVKMAIISEPKIIQYILRERPEGFIRMKKLDTILRAEGVHGVFNAEGDDWKMHRRMVAKGLDVKHQKAFFDKMLISVDRLYAKWKKAADSGEAIDIQQDFLRFTVDITTTLAFGFEMNTIEEKGGVVQDHMEKIFPMIFKRINDPIQWHKLIRKKADRDFDKALDAIDSMIYGWIVDGRKRLEDHPELKENPTNFLEAILVEAENEEDFSDTEVKGNLVTVLMAGEDTTAHTLAWAIYLLTKHPDYQAKLQSEIDGALAGTKSITEYELTQGFKFLEAIANETMRLKPVAPLLLFEPLSDVEIEGYLFKKGTRMLVHSRHATLQEENFTNGKDFFPERWMKESRCPMHSMDAYIPFGGGPRFCPGKNLALLEMKLVLSMLFKNFDVEMITPHEDISEIMAFTMMASDYKVRLKHRGGA
ncbi:MAG: cytochrome P450 [Crocinitomicaceae bacterium]|nr:cytochrome P450 [Crocinitomicaceae bacterium]